ncbi:hypothetical protein FOL47_005461 [Perkinsus chesapeaki]|uniref:Uncharacterized protein n=1 Tax=Perkinsus chesapeaki TaxID=330153 RepID=A0A7J6LXH1_PERCH|nr:hypothetical protein FOL47_005461 [Perkinsus chesapeaki]
MSSQLLICVKLLLMVMVQLCSGASSRSLGISVVATKPTDCLDVTSPGLYCWYILRDSRQSTGGVRLLSNAPGLLRSLRSRSQLFWTDPVNIGVWAGGNTSYAFTPAGNVGLNLDLHIPFISKEGGFSEEHRREIDFSASLRTRIEVPSIGVAIATDDAVRGHAYIYKEKPRYTYFTLVAGTKARSRFLKATCNLFFRMTSPSGFVTWNYEGYITVNMTGKRGGYDVHYEDVNEILFLGSLISLPR